MYERYIVFVSGDKKKTNGIIQCSVAILSVNTSNDISMDRLKLYKFVSSGTDWILTHAISISQISDLFLNFVRIQL